MCNLALLPILFIEQQNKMKFFNMIFLTCTLVCFGLLLYVSGTILSQTPEENEAMWKLPAEQFTPEKLDYKYWDITCFPMFASALIRQYNGQILNIYGESDSPGSFYTVVFCVFTIIYVCFGFSIGLTGYLAFGSGSKDTLIFNMPNQTWIGIAI